jgi:hypothetical protein
MGQWSYSFVHSWSQYQMQDSGHLHAPAAEKPQVPTRGSGAGAVIAERRKISVPVANRTSVLHYVKS